MPTLGSVPPLGDRSVDAAHSGTPVTATGRAANDVEQPSRLGSAPTGPSAAARGLLALLLPHPDATYREEHARADLVRARVLAAYCAGLYPLFGILDYIAYPEHLREFLAARAAVALAAALTLAASFRWARIAGYARALGIFATLGVVWMCAHSEGFRSNYVIGVIICFLAISTLELYRPGQLLLAQLGIFAIYFVLNLARPTATATREAVSASFFLLGSLLFCVIASLLLEHNRRHLYEARSELQVRNVALELAQTQQRELLRTITHELRTPINSVLGFIELIELQDQGLLPSTRERLKRITVASTRLLAVINDILELSRLEAGKLTLTPQDCEVQPILEEVAAETRALLKTAQVRVETSCPERLRWHVDPLRLRQIITNLAGNATKFTPAGLIGLSAVVDDAAGELVLRVSDSGIGIRDEDKPKLLEPFAQTKEGRVAGGTGLGLSISKRLVELMGGRLSFTSQLGQGTTFEIRIPAGQGAT